VARATAVRRIGAENSARRVLLLDTTEQLMVDEGYAAVSTRRVAAKAGLTPPLVHYYFPTTDDLLLAVYRRAAEQANERTLTALASDRPLEAFWNLSTDPAHTALASEMVALANHRKVIRDEIMQTAAKSRAAHAAALARALEDRLDPAICGPSGAAVLIAGVSRLLVTEESLGVTFGHDEARAFVEWLLARFENGERNSQSPAKTGA
jgi:AcrR family transcriptional regulator